MGIWEDIAKPVLGFGGAALGWMVAGPIGGMIGWGLGMGVGGALFPAEAERTMAQSSGPAQQLQPQANLGAVLPVVRGNRRIAGNVIWYEQPREVVNNNESEYNDWKDNYFTRVYGGSTAPTNRYFINFAYGVCVGPARTVRLYLGKNEYVLEPWDDIFGGSDIWTLTGGTQCKCYRINEGTNVPTEYMNKSAQDILTQVRASSSYDSSRCPFYFWEYMGMQSVSDSRIVAAKGAIVPPYRNLHYIVFIDFPISSMDAGIPALSFEVMSFTDNTLATAETDVVPQSVTNMILTNEFTGLGLDPTTYLETTETSAAADYALANDLLVALVFDQQRSVLDALQYVIQHHNGFITYADGKVAHRQMRIDDVVISWQANAALGDDFADGSTGSQWRAIA